MNTSTRITVVLTLMTALVTAGAGGVNASEAKAPPAEPAARRCIQPEQHIRGLGRGCRVEGGLFRMRAGRGRFTYTHGLDDMPSARPDDRASGTESGTPVLGSPRNPVCASTNYFHAIIASPSDVARDETVGSMRTRIATINGWFHASAVESGSPGGSDLRFLCNTDGTLRVDVVTLPTPVASTTFETVKRDLRARGFNSTSAKYVVWFDANPTHIGGSGVGDYIDDERDSADNYSNRGDLFGVVWDKNASDWANRTLLHEIGHTLGAVQQSAPNSTGTGNHCNQEYDLMCYTPDGGNRNQGHSVFSCLDATHFDCGHDDFLDAKIGSGQGGAVGSWIDTHWNIGECYVRFVVHSACASTTTPAGPVVGTPSYRTAPGWTLGSSAIPVTIAWSGSDPDGVGGYSVFESKDAGAWTQVTLPTATATSVTRSLVPGSTYRYAVRGYDSEGTWGDWSFSSTFKVFAYQESSSYLSYGGSWNHVPWSSAYGGALKVTSQAGGYAKMQFRGSNIAWVATRGTNRGKASIYIDGAAVTTIDLYASSTQARRVVFSRNVTPGVTHTIEIRGQGTAYRPNVDIDALTILG